VARIVLWQLLGLVCAAVIGQSSCAALDMNVVIDGAEKLLYVNMWGKIEKGDDETFKALVLPHIRSGHVLFKVNVFSSGGNVEAAMGIGNQIRTLQAITEAPNRFYDRRGGQWVQRSSVEC